MGGCGKNIPSQAILYMPTHEIANARSSRAGFLSR